MDVAPVAADDAWISPDAPTADALFVPAPPKGSKPDQRRARKGTTVKARGSPRRSPRASVSPSLDGSPVRNKRLQSVQKSEARVGSALRDGALLFEGPIPMPAGG